MPSLKRMIRTSRRSDGIGVCLRKRRRWYSDDGDGDKDKQDEPVTQDGEDTPPPAHVEPSRKQVEDMTLDELRAAVIETRGEAKARRKSAAELQAELAAKNAELAAHRKAQEESLRSQGKYQELAEQQAAELTKMEALETENKRNREFIEESNARRIEQLPQNIRKIVPDLPPGEKSSWLDRAIPELTRPTAPNMDGGAGGMPEKKPPSKLTALDRSQADFAAAHGYPVDPEKVAARREELEKRKSQ